MWWNEYWHAPWMFFGPLMMIVLIAACVGLMYLAMRGHRSHGGQAIKMLKERYARGEIDRVEFEERRRLLES